MLNAPNSKELPYFSHWKRGASLPLQKPDMATLQLQTPRQIVAGLVSAIPTPLEPQAASANPLTNVAGARELLLTLQVLFPNELLPALDLLDRGLVTRLRLSQNGRPPTSNQAQTRSDHSLSDSHEVWATGQQERPVGPATDKATKPSEDPGGNSEQRARNAHAPCTYYVRSAQQQTPRSNSRYRNAASEHTTYYESRLDAWSCSCPAFAFAAFPAASTGIDRQVPTGPDISAERPTSPNWLFGGLTSGTDMPVCKHLLACVLVEHSAMFAQFVEERAVSLEELAGWAAGWGD